MTAAEISRQLDLTSIKKHQWHIQACCALTGDGLVILKLQLLVQLFNLCFFMF